VFVLTDVLVDVTTLTDVAVVVDVGPGTVAVVVAVLVVPGAVEVTVAVLVVPGAVEVTVVPGAVVVTVAVVVLTAVEVLALVVADGVLSAEKGGTLKFVNPVLGGDALSCELMTMLYAVALTSVGRVVMVSGPLHVFVVAE